jgi:hypothetical protein
VFGSQNLSSTRKQASHQKLERKHQDEMQNMNERLDDVNLEIGDLKA